MGAAPERIRRCLVVALVALVAVVASACGGTGHQAVPAATTAPGAARRVTTTPGYQWSRVSDMAPLGGGPSSTIAATLPPLVSGGSWLAAGSTTDLAGDVTATAWTSPDALHWHASTLAPTGVNSQIRAATPWGDRQLAVGAIGAGPDERAAVWLSAGPDQVLLPVKNEAAFAAPLPTAAPGGDAAGSGAQMNDVVTGALGIFASGTVNGQLAMWYSSDGARWTRLLGAERVINEANQPAVNGLLVAANGVWAVGTVVNGTQSNAAVWTSTDGIHWYRVLSAQGAFAADGDREINSIATLGTGFVAVGGVRTGSQWLPASWISPDGVSWSQASEAFPESPRPTTDNVGTILTDVTDNLGVGLVVVGGSPSAQRVWTSTDGQSWSEVAFPSAVADATNWHLGLVAALGATTVVVDTTVGAPHLLVDTNGVWKEVTADPRQFGVPSPEVTPTSLVSDMGVLYLAVDVRVRSQALGHDTSSAAILSSTDGTSWQLDAQGGVFAGHEVHSLLAVQTGLLAAGNSVTTDGTAPRAALWSSSNGLTWTAAKAAPGAAQPGPATVGALARVGSTVVALGQAGQGLPAAAGQSLNAPAAAWVDDNGTLSAEGALDTEPSLATETVAGACGGPQSVVAVGATSGGDPGTAAAAWISADGRTWQSASISPSASSGASEGMAGCLSTGNGYLAYGSSPGAVGTSDPALWQSGDGISWTRQTVVAFAGTDAGPITDLALLGTTWLATVGGAPPGGPLATPTAASASCTASLWHSGDAGTTWDALDTTGAPWTASLDATANLVGFVATNPIVVGTADGRLTVWAGQATAP